MSCRCTTHPFKDEEDEGKHHGSVGAVVRISGIALFVGPLGPGSEHHGGAPDERAGLRDPQGIPGFLGALISELIDYFGTTLEDCEIRCEDDISK